ncbi:MAG: hypothetical protein GTN81_14900 [Proteobacteria bacterium]|nr:hypothetical protein [Pseudomonadota bacterium]
MQEKEVLEYLEDLAEKLGIEVIYGKLGEEDYPLRGGLCKVRGVFKIFMDPSANAEDRIGILAKALASFDTEKVYLLPYIREILEATQESS